ncbi:hypothetical protein E3O25_04115 [Cryobacterium sp. TMT1-3]|uniref:Uncharacterized protein n=1 Tax=Cryobacterium luteum TaxID=1424661 RepID=A0A1H8GAP3_9MICO|nr:MULTISPECIES: hypothetical protein [Cryobacterium]TFB93920.1 hypothetical protein E3O10_02700 [Cryobacterium luteum]TFC29952.1 hypothetical protein E3O25_04115 [Cryobacterium sp. TMT1-3]SEN41053.1 hypothetical protein SAMN05216281_107113 [Cryobacterium luteum]
MNATDPLDMMLGQSSPGTVTITPGVQRDLEVMNQAAAREVATRTPSRWTTRLVVGFGLALALTGTAGAATATGVFAWLPWAEHPDMAYAFVLPSGRACEGRIALQHEAAAGDWDAFVESMGALQVDPADIEQITTELRNDSLVVVTDDGTIEDRPPGSVPQTDDGTYAAANLVAVKMAITRLSATTGVVVSDLQVQCAIVVP